MFFSDILLQRFYLWLINSCSDQNIIEGDQQTGVFLSEKASWIFTA